MHCRNVRVTAKTYLVRVPEPSRPLLLTAHQGYPFVATTAKPLPYIRIAIHSPRLLRFLEWVPCCRADPMRETLVIPESRVLQYKPTTRLANTTPAFALIAMPAHPPGSVQVSVESQLLLMRNKVLIGRIHIFWRGRYLLLVQRSIQVWGVRQIGVMTVKGVRVGIAL